MVDNNFITQTIEFFTTGEKKAEKAFQGVTKSSQQAQRAVEGHTRAQQQNSQVTRNLTINRNKQNQATGVTVSTLRQATDASSKYSTVRNKEIITDKKKISAMLKQTGYNQKQIDSINNQVAATQRQKTESEKLQNQWLTGNKTLDNMNRKLNSVRWAMVNVAFAGALFAGFATPFVLAAREAVQMEEAIMGVSRTADLTAKETDDLKSELYDLSGLLAQNAQELAAMAKTAGQLGIAKENIVGFVSGISMISTALDLTAEETSENMAKISNAFNVPIENVLTLGSVINRLENTTAASSQELVDSLRRVGAASTSLGTSFEATAGSLSTLVSAGMSARRSGTRLRTLYSRIAMDVQESADIAGKSYKEFVKTLEESPDVAVMQVLEGLSEETNSLSVATENYGRVAGFAASTLSSRIDELKKSIQDAREESQTGESVWREFVKQRGTASAQFRAAAAGITASSEEIGEATAELAGGFANFFRVMTGGGMRMSRMYKEAKDEILKDYQEMQITPERWSFFMEEMEKMTGGAFEKTQQGRSFTSGISTYNKNYAMMINFMRFFNQQTDQLVENKKEESNTIETLTKQYGDASNSVQILAEKYKAQDNALGENFKNYESISQEITGMEGDIERLFGEDKAQLIISFAQSLSSASEETSEFSQTLEEARSKSIEYFNKALSLAQHRLSGFKQNLKDVNKNIQELSSPTFEGQMEVEHLIKNIELFKKEQELLEKGITDPYDFLMDAVSNAENGMENFLDTVYDVNNATEDTKDSYEAWKQSIDQFITSSLKQGNKLSKNVSQTVSAYQALLLSTSKFSNESEDQESAVELLRTAYDVHYGGMQNDVQQAIESHERQSSTVYNTSTQVISALRKQWLAQKKYKNMVKEAELRVGDLSERLFDAETAFAAYRGGLNDIAGDIEKLIGEYEKLAEAKADAGHESGHTFYTSSSQGSSYETTTGQRLSVEGSGEPTSPAGSDPFEDFFSGRWGEVTAGDFIWRAGQKPMKFSSDDNIVSTKRGMGGGVNIQNITVNGASGDPEEFAYRLSKEIKRQLKTI